MSAIAAWFVYGVVVSALLGLAALAAESSARATGRPTRWVWFSAMMLAVIVPAVAYLVPNRAIAGGVSPVPGVPVLSLPAMVAPAAVDVGASAGVAVLVAWALASAVLAGMLIRSASRVQAQRWRWQRTDLYGPRTPWRARWRSACSAPRHWCWRCARAIR